MENMKDWIKTKCRDAGSLLTVEGVPVPGGRALSFSTIVVTPKNIPEFTIPRSGEVSPRGSGSPESDVLSRSSESLTCSNHTSPGHSPSRRGASPHLLIPSPIIRSKSAPVSPVRHPAKVRQNEVFQGEMADKQLTTNCDPLSLAAMTLPHFKTMTKFGFQTLTESPHTRRKESLFHLDSESTSPALSPRPNHRRTTISVDALNVRMSSDEVDFEHRLSSSKRNKRRNIPALIAPLGVVLSPSAQGGEGFVHVALASSSCLHAPYASCPEIPAISPDARRKSSENAVYGRSSRSRSSGNTRRRNSLVDEPFFTDGSSTEPSPNPKRRNSGTVHLTPADTDEFWTLTKAPSSSTVSSDPSSSCSCHSLYKLELQPPADLGELKFSLVYIAEVRQLKVHIMRADNLGGSTRSEHTVNPFVKLCLMPGKLQKQTTALARHTKTPVFNQEFIFADLSVEQLNEMRLRMKVFHKSTKLGRDDLLGIAQVALDSFDLMKETRMWKILEPPTNTQELGYLQLSTCFYASAEKLTVCVHQVTDLIKHPLTGAPDSYVKVELSQPGRTECKVQTKIKKKSTNPTFNESFTFTISPKIEDLKYTTLSVTLCDHGTIRADGLIGQVRLGYGATEVSEFDHWNHVLQNPGRVFTNWHLLMEVLHM